MSEIDKLKREIAELDIRQAQAAKGREVSSAKLGEILLKLQSVFTPE